VLHVDFLLGLFFGPEEGGVTPKRRLTFNRLHGVISQRMELFNLPHVFLFILFLPLLYSLHIFIPFSPFSVETVKLHFYPSKSAVSDMEVPSV
jgi:hypothetical protein